METMTWIRVSLVIIGVIILIVLVKKLFKKKQKLEAVTESRSLVKRY